MIDKQTLSCGMAVFFAVAAMGQSPFSDGVAAGDVTPVSAILWTRLDYAGPVRVEVSTDDSFAMIVASATAVADSADDGTVKIEVGGLSPQTQHYYRFAALDDGALSTVGRFRTPPTDDSSAAFRFVFSGDTNFAYAPFGAAAQMATIDADAFVWFGDTIYADVAAGGLGVATTLPEYRAKYRQIRSDAGIRAALARMPVWTGADDHEVRNDYAGRDPDLPAGQRSAGMQAFFEYMPIREQNVVDDATRAYRKIRWGSGAVMLFIDARQYREESAKPLCGSNPDPDGFILGPLTRDGTCSSLLSAPRAMLGRTQLDWLMHELIEAGDAVKFVVNNVPLSYIGVYPFDRWDGYDNERREILEFIHDNRIRNVIFLTTDIHANAYNPDVSAYFQRYRPDYRLNGDVAIPEVIVGPLGNATLHQSLTGVASGVLGDDDSCVLGALEDLLVFRLTAANRLAFIETNRVSFVEVVSDDDGVRLAYRGAAPANAKSANEPLETFFETTVDDKPAAASPCFLPLLAVGCAGYLSRRRWTLCARHPATASGAPLPPATSESIC